MLWVCRIRERYLQVRCFSFVCLIDAVNTELGFKEAGAHVVCSKRGERDFTYNSPGRNEVASEIGG